MDKSVKFRVEIESNGQKVLHTVTASAEELREAIGGIPEVAQRATSKLNDMGSFALALNSSIEVVDRLRGVISGIADDFNSFDKGMRAVNTMAGQNQEGLNALTGQVEELANTIPLAKDQLASGLYQVISNGVPKDNWIQFLEQSSKSAVGGIADLGQTVTVTSTLIKNYGLEWDAAAALQDKIQTTAKNGVTSFEQLAQALPRVTGNAATLGVSVDELMASFATLTGVSGNTNEVSTQMAAIFTALVKPSSEAAEMAEAMGIQFDAAAIKAAGGMQNFLTNLDSTVKAYAGSNGMIAEEIYGKLFGSAEALRALIPLNGELAETYRNNVTAMADSGGTIDAAFESMSGSGEAVTQMLQNQISSMFSWAGSIASAIQPYVTYIALAGQATSAIVLLGGHIGTATKAIWAFTAAKWASIKAWVASTAATIRSTVASVAAHAVSLQLTAAIIASAVAQKAVAGASKLWAAAQVVLNAVLSANPIGIVIMAIAALVAGVILAYKKSETFRAICDKVWAVIKKLAGIIMDALVKAFNWVIEKIKIAWEWLKKFLGLDDTKTITVKTQTEDKSGGGTKAGGNGQGSGGGQPPKLTWRNMNYNQLGEEIDKHKRKLKDLIGVNDAAARKEQALIKQMEARHKSLGGKYGLEGSGSKHTTKTDKPSIGLIGKTEDKLEKARKSLRDATNEEQIAALRAEITKYEKELERLNKIGEEGAQKKVLKADASTLKDIAANIDYLNEQLQTANLDQAAAINQQIKYWQRQEDAIKSAGTVVKATLNEEADTIEQIGANIDILNEQLKTATAEQAVLLNQQIKKWEDLQKARRNAGLEPIFKGEATTLKDINNNIDILTSKLQTASIEEAAQLNREIQLWEQKAKVIKEVGKAGENLGKQLLSGWGSVKGISSSVESITKAVEGNETAWKKLTTVVDGVISILQNVATITQLITTLTTAQTAATTAGTIAKQGHAVATTTAAAASTAGATASLTAATASGTEAAADTTAAAAKTLKAHAWIPFVGVAIGAAMVGALLASVVSAKNSVPKFANGGIAYGPTLGLFGEYAGASTNPEVVAPLDKLRSLLDIDSRGAAVGGRVEFEIKGRNLVGVLRNEQHRSKRNL